MGHSLMAFIGAENIVSPLGNTAQENFECIYKGRSAVQRKPVGVNGEVFAVASFDTPRDLFELCTTSIDQSNLQVKSASIEGGVALIFSSTKGDINQLSSSLSNYSVAELTLRLKDHYSFVSEVFTVSNACVSGIVALNLANDLIESGNFEHVVVVGADLVSDFTVSGFQAFFAMSDELCKPYDKDRKGINIGEAASSFWLSANPSFFNDTAYHLLGGATRNDANHISGPSRTGEGLYRSILGALDDAKVQTSDLDYICSHGTATNYNDEMESQAFNRAGILQIPMNSLKAYFGHTLGAAGLVETAIAVQSLRNQQVVASKGFDQAGVSFPMNVIERATTQKIETFIKTGSGFGGSNSAVVISKEEGQPVNFKSATATEIGKVEIDSTSAYLNGSKLIDFNSDPLREMYDHFSLGYSKFHKMDPLCKLGVLGVEFLTRAFPVLESAKDDEVGLIFESEFGSSFSDIEHQKNLNKKNPSPAIFVYTLPNIVAGEVSIKHKWFGESITLISDKAHSKATEIADLYLKGRKIKYAICGRIEYIDASFELSLALRVLKEEI